MRRSVYMSVVIAGIVSLNACTSTLQEERNLPGVPSLKELYKPFGENDVKNFQSPPKIYHPETWFHLIGGNVSKPGITADLEALSAAGLSGIQLFHGQFGGPWPGVEPQIACLSPSWEETIKHAAEECRRLSLRFTMQNCPGWSMAGGPWIKPENSMRHLVWSRTDIDGGKQVAMDLAVPQPSSEDWRDYKDITVLAFPTPLDDTNQPLRPQSIRSNIDYPWSDFLIENKDQGHWINQEEGQPHWVEVSFSQPTPLRTIELSEVRNYNYNWCYEPGVNIKVQAILPDGTEKDILQTDAPQSSWQDNKYFTLALSEVPGVKTYRISFTHKRPLLLSHMSLYSATRKNNWEAEAGWTLRDFVRAGEEPQQSPEAFVSLDQIKDITSSMDANGHLNWEVPEGKWTVLRVGHVCTGKQNGPAPKEGTGWECNKLSETGPDIHYASYIGRLANGPLEGGLLNGMLLDSWECETQTWTEEMEDEFRLKSGYPLRQWLPAVFGYVVNDHETTTRFLLDWRNTIGSLFADKFYGRMVQLAHQNGLAVSYETAAGDIVPADLLEYFKYADIPMCEFWQPLSESFVGSNNFKPIKPTASAARMYGKPRVAAEAFTSFELTWDEHLSMLKEVMNVNSVEGVTHLVFHTYTHNPRIDFLPPGTSFGSGIGTPFLRLQTWWKYMPEFVNYLSRCTYLLERGRPVSDVLWYLGDEISHKPDQNYPFPEGFKYDYCNPDVLLNRLSVKNGKIVTPEGIEYSVLWLNDNKRMLPETLEKLLALVREGAVVIGDAPEGLATLSGQESAQKRFDAAVHALWGEVSKGCNRIGKGMVVSGMSLDEALCELKMSPDVTATGDALWLHRQTKGADWYFVTAPKGQGFKGDLSFRNSGYAEIWDPVTGEMEPAVNRKDGDRTVVSLDMPRAGSCFVVFRHDRKGESKPVLLEEAGTIPVGNEWTLAFPDGWGAPASLKADELKAWKDLDISPEGKAFSGTVTYTTSFDIENAKEYVGYSLDLGAVEMIASVSLNGKPLRVLWTPPYRLDITDAIQTGENILTVEVTGTWFNRLVYDAGQPEENRKTWTISGPSKDAPLRDSGLLGPVVLKVFND